MGNGRAAYNLRVDLADGYLALGLDVNLSTLDDRDRELVSGLLIAMLDRARDQAEKQKRRIIDAVKEQADEQLGIDGDAPHYWQGKQGAATGGNVPLGNDGKGSAK